MHGITTLMGDKRDSSSLHFPRNDKNYALVKMTQEERLTS